jgi:hypothetical protein
MSLIIASESGSRTNDLPTMTDPTTKSEQWLRGFMLGLTRLFEGSDRLPIGSFAKFFSAKD